jgi:hypothetical protein
VKADEMRTVAAIITALADADIPLYTVGNHWTGGYGEPSSIELRCYTYGAEPFAASTRALAALAGKVEKESTDDGLLIVGVIDGIRITVRDTSDQVCKKVLVGTDVVTEEVPDPDWDGDVPMVTVTREVPRYQIVCPDSVLALGRELVTS